MASCHQRFLAAPAEFSGPRNAIEGDIYLGAGETLGMRHLAKVLHDIRSQYPGIRVHLHSGNQEDVTERLDRGLLDFGVLVQPADLSRYHSVSLPEKDVWGVVTRTDSPLAALDVITRQDLLDQPLLLSRQAMRRHREGNEFLAWFGEDFAKLNVVGTFNLVYNAAILAEHGIGHVVTIRGLAGETGNDNLCFRLLQPRLETGLDVVWKKSQVFSPAAEVFLEKIRESCGKGPNRDT